MHKHQKPNPDNRADNVDKLQEIAANTSENIRETEERIMRSDHQGEQQNLKKKNEHRKESLEAVRNEIHDEVNHQQSQQ
ncbi:small acid-soluble spore protein Tlp [Bacillaceae bacterium SIJ1]|uniref:small acid-soluble spore protein Tlp n=1 Tax=Litoribacterium kuwaitense TaxID=1398745 RepID=UPI0013EBBD0E|nr:small acid-soluble spore protein Tlp [Litoribacterium kuwaitense]NGP44031.1 small acid-soluble spore protein Tlp [Litoribacterium kuwaitense]